MRVSREKAAENRERIVETASRMFRECGFDGVGIHDHPHSGRDAYLALVLAAQSTNRIRLFPATSSPMVRHPLVLASLAHNLPEDRKLVDEIRLDELELHPVEELEPIPVTAKEVDRGLA